MYFSGDQRNVKTDVGNIENDYNKMYYVGDVAQWVRLWPTSITVSDVEQVRFPRQD